MKIHVQLQLQGNAIQEETLEIEDHKVADLSEDELREAIEINVREWVNEQIQVTWEVADGE